MTSDEEIAEAVREYPCLYDKARKGHCDRDLVKNCWLKVAEKCGFEDEEEAKRLFNNLKKRYNKYSLCNSLSLNIPLQNLRTCFFFI